MVPGDNGQPPLPLTLMVPLEVRKLPPHQYEIFSLYCDQVAYTTEPGEPEPRAQDDGTIHIGSGRDLQIFMPDIPDSTDCSMYDNVDDPIIGILTSPVELIKSKDGSFDVWSHMCDMSIWDYQEGDTYRWNGDVLEIVRRDGDDKSRFRFEPESPGVDCEAYEANLDPAKPE
jgi:hypothetical protein